MSEKETNRVCYFLVHKNLFECLFICGVIRLTEHAMFPSFYLCGKVRWAALLPRFQFK